MPVNELVVVIGCFMCRNEPTFSHLVLNVRQQCMLTVWKHCGGETNGTAGDVVDLTGFITTMESRHAYPVLLIFKKSINRLQWQRVPSGQQQAPGKALIVKNSLREILVPCMDRAWPWDLLF